MCAINLYKLNLKKQISCFVGFLVSGSSPVAHWQKGWYLSPIVILSMSFPGTPNFAQSKGTLSST